MGTASSTSSPSLGDRLNPGRRCRLEQAPHPHTLPAITTLAAAPDGFTVADLVNKVHAITGHGDYTARRAAVECTYHAHPVDSEQCVPLAALAARGRAVAIDGRLDG